MKRLYTETKKIIGPKKSLTFIKYLVGQPKRRALLSYLKDPLLQEMNKTYTTQFSNNGAGRTWGKVLNLLGYEVDVVDWDDKKFRPGRKYDLIIVHGGKNYMNLLPALKDNGKIIYYSTGSYWRYHNEHEELRFSEFTMRNKYKLSQDRHIDDNEEAINQRANAIISLGNKDTAATYASFKNVYSIEAAGYPTGMSITRNYDDTRRHFLFLSGPGNIHKGLDIIIEAFRELPELHLHVVTTLNEDFEDYYRDDLYDNSNIHTYGYIPQRSVLFYAVVRQCSYSVLLSCSEGSPGSVIESIQQGLIPIVTKESHIDVPNHGVILDGATIHKLKKALIKSSTKSGKEVAAATESVIAYGEKQFAIARFEQELSMIIADVQRDDS